MPIGDLSNKVSRDDVDKIHNKRNPPEYESGFEDMGSSSGGGGLDSLFGDSGSGDPFGGFGGSSDPFGGGGGDPFGGGSDPFGGFGGSSDPFGGGFGGGFGQPKQEVKPDTYDKIFEATSKGIAGTGKVMLEVFKSIGLRSADDFAYLGRNMIITGGVLLGVSVFFSILGGAADIRFLKFSGIMGQLFGAGGLSLGTGLSAFGVSALSLLKHGKVVESVSPESFEDLGDVKENSIDEYESSADDLFESYFNSSGSDSSFGGDFGDFEEKEDEEEEDSGKLSFDMSALTPKFKKDPNKMVEEVRENTIISRETLFSTFKEFFPTYNPEFSKRNKLDPDSEEFVTLETICLKALANVARKEVEEIDTRLESAVETFFSYELRIKRVKGLNRVEDIAREFEAYFRESSSDTTVVANVDIEGDFYKAVVTKGINAIVTFGDMFEQKEVANYFKDKGNKLPIIVGVTEIGDVILDDAKDFDTMLISGKPRSGKSWYVLSILISLMAFNPPEDVQFIIVDPKESNLFKTLALMPHVAGLHNDSNILELMRDIIENEGARRKKILADNKCDDIWALWKKGIKIPVLYLVIDEVITVKSNLGALDKEFDSLLQTMISQLPSQGIRLMVVPHRSTGVIGKTNRSMIGFSAAVRSNNEDIMDTLDIKKWTRNLVHQGDIAVKLGGRPNPMYVKGGAITTSDGDNAEFILNMARAFYKMGVTLPYMGDMIHAVNRNEHYIKEELSTSGTTIQYNAGNVLKDL